MADRRRRVFWAGVVLLAGVTLAAYFPTLGNGFVWDDDSFLTQNPIIKAGDGLYRSWFTTGSPDFWPVTSTVLWTEWRLWGLHAMGYHAVNLGLHIAEALLLWAILDRLWSSATAKAAAYGAAFLFAVHPVNVESVAWIAQLKNLMAMLFYLLSIWFFLGVERGTGFQPVSSTNTGRMPVPRLNLGAYILSLLCFILAMLSKGSVAILPLVLLGLVAWRRRLALRDLRWALPYFLVAAVLAATDVWFQRHGLRVEFRHADFLERLLGAGAVVWFYLYKALLPINLVFVYPPWHVQAGNPLWWAPLLAAIGVTAALFGYRSRGTRPALFAWGYFCAALLPVMGFTDVYFMKYSLVADHYQHIAIIGVIGFVAAAWGGWDEKRKVVSSKEKVVSAQPVGAAPPQYFSLTPFGDRTLTNYYFPRIVMGSVILLLAALTWRQCGAYRDAETLYLAILDRNPDSWLAENNLANILFRSGRFREAIPRYDEALRLKPDIPEAQNNLGLALVQVGQLPEAMSHYRQAIELKPDYADAHNNLGLALAAARRPAEAIPEFQKALQLAPDMSAARFNLGNALAALGRLPEAIACYRDALRLKPDDVQARSNLGAALAQSGQVAEAIAELETAIRIDPGCIAAHEILGQILTGIGQATEGRAQLDEAARLAARKPER